MKRNASILSVTLLAFAAEHRRLLHGTHSSPATVNRYLLPARRSPAIPPTAVAAVDRWDRQTDR